jgi:hypothetical protein
LECLDLYFIFLTEVSPLTHLQILNLRYLKFYIIRLLCLNCYQIF